MPITIEWYDNQHRAIYERFIGQWTRDDLSVLAKQVDEFAVTVSWDVSILIDMSNAKSMPHGNAMMHGMNNLRQSPKNVANIVFVIDSHLLNTFANMVFGTIPTWRGRTRFVKTLQEGRQIIDKLIEPKNVIT